MKRKPIKDLTKSIHRRLLNRAKADGISYTAVFRYYVAERFLYRLSCSIYRDNFILKGATLFRVWKSAPFRTTADTDFLGHNIDNNVEEIKQAVREIVLTEVPDDGLLFQGNLIRCSQIVQRAKYRGINVVVPVLFAGKRAPSFLHIDIGFGDPAYPEPERLVLDTLLETDSKPAILCYCKENAIAEKMEAIVWHNETNSRLKDFADIYFLSDVYSFEGGRLAEAVRRTFKARNTEIDPNLSILRDEEFLKTKSAEWIRFCADRLQIKNFPDNFADVAARILEFIQPVFIAISSGVSSDKVWTKTRGWSFSIDGSDQYADQ